ncbi:hypothetical protein B0J11DRAFT_446458 [Dendryphion nanum]|uniref:F5/8 type C domain-containing protein n=1 Tax=Dendryphion nanum TaxID=256645 RepID=A0A9P9D5H2_9PLEO|nr:hypothetical protein B0J11DRAFT_446458 [Dendryphion nanum]
MAYLRFLVTLLSLVAPIYSVSVPIDRTGWTITADSQETNHEIAKAIDGLANTFWHTRWTPSATGFPHWVIIDMKKINTVNGVTVQPRQDGRGNGRIGRHEIHVSQDGTNWGNPVVIGNYLNDASTKKSSFIAKSARYVRFTALDEAGSPNNPWSSIAEINVLGDFNYNNGLWLYTVDMPIIPVAASNLPDGRVLVWSAFKLDDYVGGTGLTQTAIFDPATGTTTRRIVNENEHDMFCPGISLDFEGRIVVTGGNDEQKTTIYNPSTNLWIPSADMRIPRGYQSSTTCSDGRIFAIGGSWSGARGGKNGEIYDPVANSWSLIPNALVAPMVTADGGGMYRADNHAWLFGWKNKWVFQAGPSKKMNWYNTDGAGSVNAAGTRGNDIDAMNGNAVMYDAVEGRILTMGGAVNYQTVTATSNAFNMTIGTPPSMPQVARTQNMAYQRGFANAVVLPDGSVFVTGGQAFVEPFTDTTASYEPELWNPNTGTWRKLSPHGIPRTYHSVALLLPDATIFNGGGGLCGGCPTNHWDAEIFVPPYLLNSDGSRKARPAINTVADTVKLGAALSITTSGSVTSFALIRHGAVTHSVNTDQRRIPLKPAGNSSTSYTVTIPHDAGVALPGYWFLFAIDSAGTPSIAKTIRVTT